MPKRDTRVTRYIDTRAPFARPILRRLRATIHAGDPRLREDLKWGMPTFLLDQRIICGIAAFTGHCALWFWRGRGVVTGSKTGAMGQFGRITSLADLPSAATVRASVKKAVARHALNDHARRTKRPAARALRAPRRTAP